jgi:hypothetical protein
MSLWTPHELRKLFFSLLATRWMKVAMVIAKVANAMGRDLPTGDEGCQVISEHIEVLIGAGRLEAAGRYEKLAFQRGQAIRIKNAWLRFECSTMILLCEMSRPLRQARAS